MCVLHIVNYVGTHVDVYIMRLLFVKQSLYIMCVRSCLLNALSRTEGALEISITVTAKVNVEERQSVTLTKASSSASLSG